MLEDTRGHSVQKGSLPIRTLHVGVVGTALGAQVVLGGKHEPDNKTDQLLLAARQLGAVVVARGRGHDVDPDRLWLSAVSRSLCVEVVRCR